MSDTLSFQLRRPDQMAAAERAELGRLILSGFPLAHRFYDQEMLERLRAEAWRTVPPVAHLIAYTDKHRPVGQQSLFHLAAPGLDVYGLGDIVVAHAFRGRGIARQLVVRAVDEARRAGAQAICTRTTKLAGVFADLGFVADERGAHFTDENGLPLAYLMVWLASGISAGSVPLTPSDF